jgi:hypothetical protein
MRTNGPGKYDAECTAARVSTGAVMVALIVLNGDRGSGFSIQGTDPDTLRQMPGMLEFMARQMRAEMTDA